MARSTESESRENVGLLRFNAGRLSPRAAARVDLPRYKYSAEVMENWMPDQLGCMAVRPGTEFITRTRNDLPARYMRFVYARDDTALIELTDSTARFLVDEVLVSRPAVSTAISNSDFTSGTADWVIADEAGASSTWASGIVYLIGTGATRSIKYQSVSVAPADVGVEHGLRVVVSRGPIILRVGSTLGGTDYINEVTLATGTYSLAFTPLGSFYVWIAGLVTYPVGLDSISIESSGPVEIPTPWAEADMPYVNYKHAQSGDVIFAACHNTRPQRIVRYGNRSWAVTDFVTDDGPFRAENVSTLTLTQGASSGVSTLTASRSLFSSAHIGALFKLTHSGQNVSATISAEDQYANSVIVTGVTTNRVVVVSVSGTFTASVTLQRSYDGGATWATVKTYTGAISSESYNDGLDNQEITYRIGVKPGDYTSGTASVSLAYARGTTTGVGRVYEVTSSVSAGVVVVKPFSTQLGATSVWAEGQWSDYRGWPSAVAFHEGRLCFAGKDRYVLSVSDAFYSYDDSIEGDSAPIAKSIGSGPVDRLNWMAGLQRLAIGGEGAEHYVYSSTLDEVLTPTNANRRAPTNLGSARIEAEKLDDSAIFVQATESRIYRTTYDASSYAYSAEDLLAFCPEFGDGKFLRLDVQRMPDTRIWAPRRDGSLGLIVYSRPEFQDINCLCDITTDGTIEDVVVLPRYQEEDAVYICVARTQGETTVRTLERFARADECVNGLIHKGLDSSVTYQGAATTTITGLDHLEGFTVMAWAEGAYVGEMTVTGGEVTLPEAANSVTVGLPYTACYQTFRIATAAATGYSLGQTQRVARVALLMRDAHKDALTYGSTFDELSPMPQTEGDAEVPENTVYQAYNEMSCEFDGEWTTDSRVCLQSVAPYGATVLCLMVTVDTNERR